MTRKRPIGHMDDKLAILQAAIEHGGVRVPCGSVKYAVAFRHQLYRARKAFYERSQNPCYNDTYMQIELEDGTLLKPGQAIPEATSSAAKATILVKLYSRNPLPRITDLDGNPIDEVAGEADLTEEDKSVLAEVIRNIGGQE